MQVQLNQTIAFEGKAGQLMDEASRLQFNQKLTVTAWVHTERLTAERIQPLVSKWQVHDTLNTFEAYDAGETDGLDTTGFLGAVFDGRYLYFAPQHNTQRRHGCVLRYDTHLPFKNKNSWQAYNAEETSGLVARGYYGAVFDGVFIYFTPRMDGKTYHTRILRYDTRLPFQQKESWSAYDVGLNNSYQGCAFDGRYVYFAPGSNADKTRAGGWPAPALRYDTKRPFNNRGSYEIYELSTHPGLEKTRIDLDGISFDGRYMYFAPIIGNLVVRYDTQHPFTSQEAWTWFKPQGLERCVGPVFDGHYVYFGGYNTSRIVRYNASLDFLAPDSWQCIDLKQISQAQFFGYDGGFFDGRYLYFVPFYDQSSDLPDTPRVFHSQLMRYDTSAPFESPRSWSWKDVSRTDGLLTIGYNAGATDGRYLYCAPWHDGVEYVKQQKIQGHGRVLRYDTVGNQGTFVLKLTDYGHNGGLCGALPGPSFIINTDAGVFSARANFLPSPGWHHLAGVYDGNFVKLYLDGELINQQPAKGQLCANSVPVILGGMGEKGIALEGILTAVTLHTDSLAESTIQAMARQKPQIAEADKL